MINSSPLDIMVKYEDFFFFFLFRRKKRKHRHEHKEKNRDRESDRHSRRHHGSDRHHHKRNLGPSKEEINIAEANEIRAKLGLGPLKP